MLLTPALLARITRRWQRANAGELAIDWDTQYADILTLVQALDALQHENARLQALLQTPQTTSPPAAQHPRRAARRTP